MQQDTVLSAILAYWDECLDDPAVLAPFEKYFSPMRGRPTIPLAMSMLRRL